MTANQIAYHTMKETKRSNLEKERETAYHNRAVESETFRHNTATEDETHRSNTVNEAFNVRKQVEQERTNKANENIKYAQLAETKRKNSADIGLNQNKLEYQKYIDDEKLTYDYQRLQEEARKIDQEVRKVDELIRNNLQDNLIDAIEAQIRLQDVEYSHKDRQANVAAGAFDSSINAIAKLVSGIPMWGSNVTPKKGTK